MLGVTWNAVDFKNNTVTIDKQLQRERKKGGKDDLVSLKTDDKCYRVLEVAPSVMSVLRRVKAQQAEWKLALGGEWQNRFNLVFTYPNGKHMTGSAVYKALKKIVAELGLDAIRFHDLRHSFALCSLQNGDSLKEVQEAMGHSTITTTMDVYGHVSKQMKKESAERMDTFIASQQSEKT